MAERSPLSSATSGSPPSFIFDTLSADAIPTYPSYVNSLESRTFVSTSFEPAAPSPSPYIIHTRVNIRTNARNSFNTQPHAVNDSFPTITTMNLDMPFQLAASPPSSPSMHPRITTLHFVLVDCTATYGAWDTAKPSFVDPFAIREYPKSLRELHVPFAYTSSPPSLLMDAPRGTFSPAFHAGFTAPVLF
ncbi:hypothetical protein C8R45DRAFT_1102435 [Mycena sanguinolenta]|nr:hypothetical protein C8R45DRAFT_1102435 [Mycena sanguinolenta]